MERFNKRVSVSFVLFIVEFDMKCVSLRVNEAVQLFTLHVFFKTQTKCFPPSRAKTES